MEDVPRIICSTKNDLNSEFPELVVPLSNTRKILSKFFKPKNLKIFETSAMNAARKTGDHEGVIEEMIEYCCATGLKYMENQNKVKEKCVLV